MRCGLLTAALLALVACDPPVSRPLPDELVAVVRLQRGGYASLLVHLPRPGEAPTVRMSPGVVAAGPGWAAALHLAEGERPGEPRALELRQLDGQRLVQLPVRGPPTLLSIDRDGAQVRIGERVWWMDASRSEVRPAALPAAPGGARTWDGPRAGFALDLEENRLALRLPRNPGEGTPLVHGVDALLGSWWLRWADVPDWEKHHLNSLFKEVGVLAATGPGEEPARADGVLDEWRGTTALPVDAPSQILQGGEYWFGPRDASFGVAARVEDGHVHIGIRIRDDRLVAGEDRLEVLLAGRRVSVPLRTDRGRREGEGWEAAFTEPQMPGLGAELRIEVPEGADWAEATVLPLVVRYIDHEPGQGSTWLGTSAWPELVDLTFTQLGGPR